MYIYILMCCISTCISTDITYIHELHVEMIFHNIKSYLLAQDSLRT